MAAITAAIVAALLLASAADAQETIYVEPESRCTPYDPADYPYPRSVEQDIVDDQLGGVVYGPYTQTIFGSIRETDIEHIVARSEAHDSGLCAADAETRRAFARDPLNLTLASPAINRHAKSDRDAGEWLPPRNRCWYAARVVAVKNRYGLSYDLREYDALRAVLATCASIEMQ